MPFTFKIMKTTTIAFGFIYSLGANYVAADELSTLWQELDCRSLAQGAFDQLSAPTAAIEKAAGLIRDQEDLERLALGDPDFRFTAEGMNDDLLKSVEILKVKTTTLAELTKLNHSVLSQEESAQIHQAAKHKQLEYEIETSDQADANASQRNDTIDTENEVRTDLETIINLQATFETLKTKLGTEGALRTFLELGHLKSTKMKDLVRRALDSAQALKSAIPAKSHVVDKLLNQAPLNLAGENPTNMFSGFLSAMETSPDLNDEDKRELRSVFIKEQSIHTGREVRSITTQTVTDSDTRISEPAYPEGHPKQVRKGVEAFTTDGDDLVLRFQRKNSSPLDYDVTDWPDSSIGLVTEALGLAVGLEDMGLEAPLDAEDLQQLRRVLSSLIGGFEAYDGDIFDAESRRGLLTYHADLLGLKDLEPDQKIDRMKDLCLLRQGGQLNFDAVQRFGLLNRNTFDLQKPSEEQLKCRSLDPI